MKCLQFLFIWCLTPMVFAQHTPLPHRMVYGTRPSTTQVIPAWRVEAFMDTKTRINTTLYGRIIKVTKPKGGWFELDAGKGKIIAAHFKNYGITLPVALKGKTVLIEGVAQKQFMADDLQHYAGDAATQHKAKVDPLKKITFEVTGLMVD